MVELSLRSIGNHENVTLHVLTDECNFNEFDNLLKSMKKDFRLYKLQDIDYHSLITRNSSYEEYGSFDFARINIMKWKFLTFLMIRLNQNELIVFSDFDILWMKSPLSCFLSNKSTTMAAQSEWHKIADINFCTGIISFLNNKDNYQLIRRIERHHEEMITTSKTPYFDQQAFNDYLLQTDNIEYVFKLDPDLFVIGRDIPHVLRNQFTFDNSVAYHANYLRGEKKKTLVMNLINLAFNHPKLRILISIYIDLIFLQTTLIRKVRKNLFLRHLLRISYLVISD